MAKCRGADHPRWNGGRKQSHGYISVFMPTHPRATASGYMLEHLLIAERALGRFLPTVVEVHHVNEQRGDNRNQNLVICEDCQYHKTLHQRKRAVEAGVPAHWLKCKFCKQYDAPSNLKQYGKRGVRQSNEAGHPACYAEKDRARYAKNRELIKAKARERYHQVHP